MKNAVSYYRHTCRLTAELNRETLPLTEAYRLLKALRLLSLSKKRYLKKRKRHYLFYGFFQNYFLVAGFVHLLGNNQFKSIQNTGKYHLVGKKTVYINSIKYCRPRLKPAFSFMYYLLIFFCSECSNNPQPLSSTLCSFTLQ